MSWQQRPGSAAPPERPQYPPHAQPYDNQQAMYPNYQQGAPPQGNPQQQYWQNPQQQQYGQQYNQVYQQDYRNNANQLYQQQPQYNQNYSNQVYTNQQGIYQNQQGQKQPEGWEDNWGDWGWDESTKQQQQMSQNVAKNLPANVTAQQPQVNNANVIEESFGSNDTWNWSMDDRREVNEPTPIAQPEIPRLTENVLVKNDVANPPKKANEPTVLNPTEEVKTLSDRDAVKERLPNLAVGKRFHLENLTPQWSIESQMSQESSDGPHTQSEGTYRSENQSRNSSKSSPGLNTDNSNFCYSQPSLDEFPASTHSNEWSRRSMDEPTLVDNVRGGSRRESHDEISSSLQEMSITNREVPAPDAKPANLQECFPIRPPSGSPAHFIPHVSTVIPPPPKASGNTASATPPLSQSSSGHFPTPPSSTGTLLPPPSFPTSSSSSSTNPFKQSGPFSHKKPSASPSLQSFPTPLSNTNLTSPASVNKISQNRVPVGFGANLETTPDNSERPDQPQLSAFRSMPVTHQVPENMEVAPQNDRNEYMQTAHLSTEDFGENTDFSRAIPPPGLRRMVVGQPESEYEQSSNIGGDEPPPGLARMVPGQQTEAENNYIQPNDNYMDRQIDGQPTESMGSARPYRQADGQTTPDNYSQPPTGRSQERRSIDGMDRMVPGESINIEFSQYSGSNYGGNDQRVVMGVDHDYPGPDAGPSDIREQNVDGSDYSEQASRNSSRNVIGARDVNDVSQDIPPPVDEQREVIMEGENLQDLSIISSAELTFSREHTLDGADMTATDGGTDRRTDLSDSVEHGATGSRRQSLTRVHTSGEESDRDRAFKASPRRDRDKHKSTRDRDRDRDKDRDRYRDKEGRYSRGDRKYRDERDAGRDERRPEKERRDRGDRDRDRRERDESPDTRRHRRSTRSHRYETEDTDYSDRERERRRYREGSYTSKPPRPDDNSRRHDDRNRTRRYNTIERDGRRYDDERDGASRSGRREKYKYRDIDPTKKYGNLRLEREEEERRRGEREAHSSPSRPGSREAAGEVGDPRRRERDRRHGRQDPYYDSFGGYTDAYALQRQQYQYYEHLRLTDPAAYLLVYKQLMAGRAPPVPPHYRAHLHKPHAIYPEGYGALGYDTRPEERGSVHSGRSSTNGLKGNDTDLNTDASLNLHLEESTVRSERMTPFKFSTAHVKGSVSSRHIVVVRPSYPVDGLPATVHILSLTAALASDPVTAELANYPGPLVRGVTHKKSVIDYCAMRVRGAAAAAAAPRTHTRDVIGYVLLWEFLALLLRQNGVVVGTDIAELLMKNKQEYEYKQSSNKSTHNDSRRGSSSVSGQEGEQQRWSPEQPSASVSDLTPQDESTSAMASTGVATGASARSPTDTLRELLTYGNRQEAIEYAMSNNLWGHALLLAAHAHGERRTRATVASRFVSALPKDDPLHTLYALLQTRVPPAAACVSDERWGDWRPHAAIMLSNSSAKPDQDKRTLIQLGDSLSSRGLIYSAQFCYLSAGAPLSRHPLAPYPPSAPPASPPRLSLLLADARATSLAQLATNQAIFATEVYEYALSLNQDYVIDDLQVYKFTVACRLCDAGQYERALAYTEAIARAVTRNPHAHAPAFIAQLADLAERLKYHEPALGDVEGEETLTEGSQDGSPRHQQWLHDVTNLAKHLTNEAASQQSTPQHQLHYPQQEQQHLQQQYSWGDQSQQPQAQQQQYPPPQVPTYSAEEYSQYYQQPPPPPQDSQQQEQQHQQEPQYPPYGPNPGQEEWQSEPQPQPPPYGDEYWRPDNGYSYGETDTGLCDGDSAQEVRPAISMPAARPANQPNQGSVYADPDDDTSQSQQADRDTPPLKGDKSKEDGDKAQKGKSGWLGGILTKLSLRPPNQMILPDDKNPTIVWDPDKKRWRNLDADGEQDAHAHPPPPPPKIQHLAPQIHNQPSMPAPPAPPVPGAEAPPAAPVANIFKMQKGRHIKKSYVDVFNPSGAATRALPPAAEVLGPAPPPAPAAAYFVPPAFPTTQTGVYTHSQVGDDDTYTAPF